MEKETLTQEQQEKIDYIFNDSFGRAFLKKLYKQNLLTEKEYNKGLIEFKKQLDKMSGLIS